MDIKDMLDNNLTVELVKLNGTKQIVILNPGIKKVMPDGKTKLVLLVEYAFMQIGYIPNKTSLKNISAKYTTETNNWVGKVLNLELQHINGKEAIVSKPLIAEAVKNG